MEDQLVTFETAKLAKKLGFNEVCLDTYDDKGILQNRYNIDFCDIEDEDDLKDRFETVNSRLENYCTAPTQSLLQRWLREKHNLIVTPDYNSEDLWNCKIYSIDAGILLNWFVNFHTHDGAIEEGLQQALNKVNETK